MLTATTTDVDEFYNAYIEAALWSSTDDDGEPLDRYDYEIDAGTLAKMRSDCERFIAENRPFLAANLVRTRYGMLAQAGHDFWLTRHSHGCGFDDGDWREPAANVLTNSARSFRECHLYVGDDGKIHLD